MNSSLEVRQPRRVLFLAANPKGTPQLRLDEEYRQIKDSLKQSNSRDRFEVIVELSVTISHIRRALLEYQPEIVHFCGHGAGLDGIACEDESGQVKLIPTTALSNLFRLVKHHVKCVVLNACFAEIQANEVVKHIDYVVGMQHMIGDSAALRFTDGFYDALFAGKRFTECYKWGVNAIQLENIPEDLTPIIRTRFKERLVGYYWEQVHEHQDVRTKEDFHFQPQAVATTLFVYTDPSNGKLRGVDITTLEIYYYIDPTKRTSGIKIGGYTAEWYFTESEVQEKVNWETHEAVTMIGRPKRRPGLDVSVAGLPQLGIWDDKVVSEYQAFIRNIRETFNIAKCEYQLTDEGSIIRKIWYNDKEGHPDDICVFIRNEEYGSQ